MQYETMYENSLEKSIGTSSQTKSIYLDLINKLGEQLEKQQKLLDELRIKLGGFLPQELVGLERQAEHSSEPKNDGQLDRKRLAQNNELILELTEKVAASNKKINNLINEVEI